jgi:AcrR family transcriptional regulator
MRTKEAILRTATSLFATQGFDGTPTLQIASEAGVTEPMIFYHFDSKDELFKHIIQITFSAYFERADKLAQKRGTPFKKIQQLVELHFDIVSDMPDAMNLVVSTCPARLRDPEDICTRNTYEFRRRLIKYFTKYLKEGIKNGEFVNLSIKETAELLTAITNGIVRYRAMGLNQMPNMKKTTIDFCRRSLLKK